MKTSYLEGIKIKCPVCKEIRTFDYYGLVVRAKWPDQRQEAVDFLIKTKREAERIKQECIVVLEMIRRR